MTKSKQDDTLPTMNQSLCVDEDTFELKLLAWYAANKRPLPWRINKDPYRVLVSEFMLQQTTVAIVIPYFLSWMEKWPSLQDLANATEQEVLYSWQGLGYYARARNLLRAVQLIQQKHRGQVPNDLTLLAQLPGIGPYTATAIAAIAFDEPVIPIDGNVMRIFSRYALISLRPASLKAHLTKHIIRPQRCPGDVAQALMDLGSGICRPHAPDCLMCPLQEECQAFQQGCVAQVPTPPLRRILPQRYTWAFIIRNGDGAILLRQRPNKGLLASLMEVPSTPWRSDPWSEKDAFQECPVKLNKIQHWGEISHTFTHFRLSVRVSMGESEELPSEGFWTTSPQDFALPTLMKKILRKEKLVAP